MFQIIIISRNVRCTKGSSESSVIGVFHVSTCSSRGVEAFLSRDQKIVHNRKEGERNDAKSEEVSYTVFCKYFYRYML